MRFLKNWSAIGAFVGLSLSAAHAALTIQSPDSQEQIYIGTNFSVSGNGGAYSGATTEPVEVKCWKNFGESGNPPACSGSEHPDEDGLWDVGPLTYNGAADELGYIQAKQTGNNPHASVTVRWTTAPGGD